jgi:hypothetical protein
LSSSVFIGSSEQQQQQQEEEEEEDYDGWVILCVIVSERVGGLAWLGERQEGTTTDNEKRRF